METAINTKTKWNIDTDHSEIGFKVKHLMVANVRGSFKEFDGSIYTTDEDFLSAEIDFWINPASITTRNENRDAHLKNADFSNADLSNTVLVLAEIEGTIFENAILTNTRFK